MMGPRSQQWPRREPGIETQQFMAQGEQIGTWSMFYSLARLVTAQLPRHSGDLQVFDSVLRGFDPSAALIWRTIVRERLCKKVTSLPRQTPARRVENERIIRRYTGSIIQMKPFPKMAFNKRVWRRKTCHNIHKGGISDRAKTNEFQ